jgi:hypothetical protein
MDLIFGNVLRHFYFKQKSGFYYHLIYSLDSTEAEVIILGSSRASRHYVPEIIEDSLNLTCFNTGVDGNYMFNNYAVYKSIIERYTPKVVLMDINPGEIYTGTEGYDQLAPLLPFYKTKKEIKSVIHLKSKFERLKLISKIYPFNSSLLAIVTGILQTEDINVLKGYMPLFGNVSDTTIGCRREENKEIDINKIKVLEALASDCDDRNIKLVFIQSPKYIKVIQETSVSLINKLASNHGAEFWNYVNDTVFLKPEYFKDANHMNNSGAYKFTRAIADRIKGEGIYGVLSPAGLFK